MEELEEKKSGIMIPANVIGLLGSALALCLCILLRIIGLFTAINATVVGILAIVIYGLAIFGVVVTLLKNKKFNSEFWVSALVLALIILVF